MSIKDKCAIVGMGCTKFGERYDTSFEDLIVEAAYEAFEDAKIESKDLDAGWIGFTSSSRTGESMARPLKLHNIAVTHVENACASGMEAIRNACHAVACGEYKMVIALGAEKLKDSGLAGLPQPGGMHYIHPAMFTQFNAPANYALAATRYFYRYGIEPRKGKETLAKITVKNHFNGARAPKAHLRNEVTVEQVMAAPIIAYPLGLFDCCPTTDGAAAAIITTVENAKKMRNDYILVRSFGLSIGEGMAAVDTDYDWTHWEETIRASQKAYASIGVKDPRTEISLAEVHDCFSISELIVYEGLGFSEAGKASEDVDAGTFALTGRQPVNPDGGLKAFGHPVGASGVRKVFECYKQLQGKVDDPRRQIKNPKLALAHSQGGQPGAFECVVCITGLPA
ncbi:MAG: acetyl-CoA acetyltransferase [Dehalococcoidia bacterium]|nr:acetyl-CoA acetyltransferase [Dehalococcoidia bacterium]